METTEKIVESYCRYVKNWFTISNIKLKNGEIDLLAVDTSKNARIERYHIEVSISISSGFARLTAIEFDPVKLKERNNQPSQRRTVGYFETNKFNKPEVVEKLRLFGFLGNNYHRIIVSWGWTDEAKAQAKEKGIELWDFREIITEIGEGIRLDNTYFTDDTLRTIHLYAKAVESKTQTK
jgi:hypothetical protein